jgi:uncharacterized glyoxalase superfamily protein PhnB/predicted enzyme related to lactoylglutathione lyase
MTDAFDALRRPDAPIAPSESFARQLRRQLTDALQPLLATPTRSRGSTMTVTPYLSMRNAAAALDFYRDAFDAVETQRLVGDDGRIGHAEMMIGNSKLMLADEYPEVDALGPESRGGTTCGFTIDLPTPEDVDRSFAHALELGAVEMRPPRDEFYGHTGTVKDPFGHVWSLTAPMEQLSTEEYARRAAEPGEYGSFRLETPTSTTEHDTHDRQTKHHERGDLYYFVLPVKDLARAQRFFTAVLGWQFPAPDQGHIGNISAPPGAVNVSDDAGARLWFVVDDIQAAVDRVRANGGTADEPALYDSGWSADCIDDQGTVFSLSVPTYTR